MPDQKIPARSSDRDDVAREAVGGFVEREQGFVINAVRIVRVVVIEDQRHAEQGPERLGDDVRGNEMAVENIRAVRKKERRECGEIQREIFFRRK